MTNRVKDILINVESGDFSFSSKNRKSLNYYDIIWGSLFDGDGSELYANICIPSDSVSLLNADSSGRYKLYFHTDYYPYDKPFIIRLVTETNGSYSVINQNNCAFPVISLAYLSGGDQARIKASELPFINMDGYYVAHLNFGDENNKAYIYSAGNVDFNIGISDEQAAQLLSLCAPGKYYRYPLSGVDITKYINTVVGHTDLSNRISDEFDKDNIDAQSISFDSLSGKIDVQFKHEEKRDENIAVFKTSNLDLDIIDVDDAYLERVASIIDLDSLDIDYEDIEHDMNIPNASLESCFANGIWIGAYPWTGAELWKGQE